MGPARRNAEEKTAVRYDKALRTFVIVAAIGWVTPAGADAVAEDPSQIEALTDLVRILRDQGVLDEVEYAHLTAKAEKREASDRWTNRISLWGDFRGRYEGFFYNGDDADVPDRNRLRYRFRLNIEADINDRAKVLVRLASGDDDDRSTNQSFGDLPAFASDPIRLDRAYLRMSPYPGGRLPNESGSAWVEFGKVPNPYVWKVGRDFMLWDHDINLEGANILLESDLGDDLNVFFNTGYYVVEERAEDANPNLVAAQVGGHYRIDEDWSLGARTSWFRFGEVTDAQLLRGAEGVEDITSNGGNLEDGMTGGSSINVIEAGFYIEARLIDNWPITLFGNVSSNLSAQRSTLTPLVVGKNDLAWGIGGEIGDEKQWVKLGMGYWHLEANAFFSQFVDSDLFDGRTNRKGFAFYLSKQLMKNTEFALTAFWSRPIQTDLPEFENSVPKSNRVRIIADMKLKF
jgi:hypothetical protein